MYDGRFSGVPSGVSPGGGPPWQHHICGHGGGLPLLRVVGLLIAAVAAVLAAMVSVFSGIVAFDPLREVATAGPARLGADHWWPLLVYGPWMVASLSILRSALHGRRAAHSWCVVLFFSAVAVLLGIARVPRTLPDMSAAALPAIAALTGFQQLVHQILPVRPPCRAVPRHRDTSRISR